MALCPLRTEGHDGVVRPERTELAITVRSTTVVVPDEVREHHAQVVRAETPSLVLCEDLAEVAGV